MLSVTTPAPNDGMSAIVVPSEKLDIYEDPFAAFEELQDSWKQRQQFAPWSADDLSEVDLGDIDWRTYSPPSGMREVADISAEILLEIITTSIDNVVAKNEQEKLEELENASAQKATIEEAAKEAEKSKKPYLPIIILERADESPLIAGPSSTNEPKSRRVSLDEDDLYSDDSLCPADSISVVSRREKKRNFILRKIFQRHTANINPIAESSASGAAREAREEREARRQYLNSRLSKINVESTNTSAQETIAALRRNTSFKVPEKQQIVECVSCLDDFAIKDTIRVPCHNYCKECFVRLVIAACQNEQQWPPKCCLNEIPFRTVRRHIPEGLKLKFQERESEWNIPIAERVYCSQSNCGLWIQPANIDAARRIGRCDQDHTTCTICRGVPHGSTDCPSDPDMNLTNQLAEEEGWKRCTQCNSLVEHREACQHMTCRCGYQFCYVCTRRWRTCQCTMEQLNNLKSSVDQRREQRRLREETEAAELREILAQIEAFEREEERRAELERQEQIRLEEERWEKLLRERIHKETIRRQDVKQKFEQLRVQLDQLHTSQKLTVVRQQEEATTASIAQSQERVEEMKQNHAKERADIQSRISTRVSDKENEFKIDYALRVGKEMKLEQEYEQQLREYWNELENSEDEIEEAMLRLRQRLDQHYEMWQEWRDTELAIYRKKLDDECAIREELMYSALHRLCARNNDADTEMTRKIVAEKKWVHQIILERQRLLVNAKVAEIDGDADSLFTAENLERIGANSPTLQPTEVDQTPSIASS